MRVMLDSGIFSHSEFAEAAMQTRTIQWAGHSEEVQIGGLIRKKQFSNREYQRQTDSLFTVGRLI